MNPVTDQFYETFAVPCCSNNSWCPVKLIDLAPETEGAMEFIDQVKDEVHVSIAHTTADYVTATEAIHRGVDHITHLYNAMPPFGHRTPGVIGAARDSECFVEQIGRAHV